MDHDVAARLIAGMYPIVLLLLVAGGPPRVHAAPPADSAGFVTVLGRDTVALENYRRSASRLEGEFVLRVPSTVYFRYVVDLRGDGSASRSTLELKPATPGGPAARRVVIEFVGDSARVTVDSSGGRSTVTRAAPRGTIPMLTTGFGPELGIYVPIGMYELAAERVGQSAGDSVAVPVISPFSGRAGTRQVVRRSATLVDVDYFRIAWTHVTVDPDRHVQQVDMSETTEKTMSRRSAMLNIAASVKEFAARDGKGQGIGRASPPDSARLTIGGASVAVDYSSPRLRGRKIVGETVPYDRVWRTGANAASVLRTDKDLTVGGTRVAAGTYTLWTLPKTGGVELIINTQHGQWGTEYKPELDYARVPMTLTKANAPRENFAILLVPKENDAELQIAWDDFVWSVPVVVR